MKLSVAAFSMLLCSPGSAALCQIEGFVCMAKLQQCLNMLKAECQRRTLEQRVTKAGANYPIEFIADTLWHSLSQSRNSPGTLS